MNDKSKLFLQKQYGDLVTVARLMDTTPNNAAQLLRRTNAKRHQEALEALGKIIETRENLITHKK
jgi:hypothetical protein